MKKNKLGRKKIIYISILAIILPVLIIWFLISPSNNLEWSVDQAILPYGEIDEDNISIYNIRNFNYRNTTDYDVDYYNKTFDLNKLDSMWYVVEPFSGFKGSAHTFLSFGFSDEYVSISAEIKNTMCHHTLKCVV